MQGTGVSCDCGVVTPYDGDMEGSGGFSLGFIFVLDLIEYWVGGW
jgi:hypothetical protein